MNPRAVALSPHRETRGTLTTDGPDGAPVVLHAWFRLSHNGARVIARRVGGRRYWYYAAAADVVRFEGGKR